MTVVEAIAIVFVGFFWCLMSLGQLVTALGRGAQLPRLIRIITPNVPESGVLRIGFAVGASIFIVLSIAIFAIGVIATTFPLVIISASGLIATVLASAGVVLSARRSATPEKRP